MTVKSKDPSESFGFPLVDFPLFFATAGAGFSGLFGAISLTEFLFMGSPEKGALQIGDRASGKQS
jgi:hypothetical protein